MPERIPRTNVNRVETPEARIPSVPIIRQVPPAITPPPPVVTQIPQPNMPVPGYVPPSFTLPNPRPSPSVPQTTPSPRPLNTNAIGEYAGPLNVAPITQPKEKEEQIEVFGQEIPIPRAEVVALAGTTAIASVAAALLGKALVELLVKLMKPIIKKAYLKTKRAIGLSLTHTEVQSYLSFEEKNLKAVMKDLEKERKASLEEQLQRQHK